MMSKDPTDPDLLDISIIIKALNEEEKIAASIESALSELSGFNGEVILADSVSTDKTIEIARRYPIKIVQLSNAQERCCGIGPQLGYQHSQGKYVYILDGDMQFIPGFLRQAFELMESDLNVGGVAGLVNELGGGSYEFENRKEKNLWSQAGKQNWLEMGALYRRSAIESVGHFSNRNLHSCEEQELGLRLSHKNWILVRIATSAITHQGHSESTFALMAKRWASHYVDGSGELLRASMGKAHFWDVVSSLKTLLVMSAAWIAFVMTLVVSPWTIKPLLVTLTLLCALFVVYLIKKKNLQQACTGFFLWPVRIAGLIRGLIRRQIDPSLPISSVVVSTAET